MTEEKKEINEKEERKKNPSLIAAKFGIEHFHLFEYAITEKLDEIQNNPHANYITRMQRITDMIKGLGEIITEDEDYIYDIYWLRS